MKKIVTIAEQKAIDDYADSKDRKVPLSDAAIGFMKKNGIVGKTPQEIDALLSSAERLKNGTLIGEGDKFLNWCVACGRTPPSEELVTLMNRDPFEAAQFVKRNIPTQPSIWRSWCSYRAGKGRRSV